MDHERTLKLTYGAMAVAIFGLMLFLNRQTGTLFEEFLLFVYPLPMVAYAAVYGFSSGLPAMLAMMFLSFFFGDFISIFYAVSQAFIGWIFGGCLHRKTDQTKVLLLVMLMSVVMNLVDVIFMSFLSGIDLNAQVTEMQDMLNEMISLTGFSLPENFLTFDYLRQMFLISMAVIGVLQGFVVYELSILILRRLRFPVPRLKNIFEYAPPKWTGLLAMLGFLIYYASVAGTLADEILNNIALSVGILGYVYLMFFGFLGTMLTLRAYVTRSTVIAVIAGVLLFVIFPAALLVIGLLYLSTGFHEHLMEKIAAGRKMAPDQKNR